MEDLYTVLGVKPDASVEEVRRAFRKFAVVLHPDRNPDPAAAERFKGISGAYETLSDAEKRRKYDESKKPKPPPNYPVSDVYVEVEVDGRDMKQGGEKTVTVSRSVRCRNCGGGGRLAQPSIQRCVLCGGAGCGSCGFRGMFSGNACGMCWTSGVMRELTTIRLEIPVGIPPYGRKRFVAHGDLWGTMHGPFYVDANIKFRVQKPGLIIR
jgi:molecular chaperone DnaJ